MTEKRMFARERRLTFAANMRFVIRERFRRTVPERETLAGCYMRSVPVTCCHLGAVVVVVVVVLLSVLGWYVQAPKSV